MVRENTVCVYLRATVETLVRNLDEESENRPMLSNEEPLNVRVAHLMALRAGTYEQTAQMVIDTDGKSIAEIAMEIHRNLDKIS
jgi:shikimate kinase